MIRAFIFDLDGTLVETEPLRALSHARAALELRPNSFTEADVVEACKEWVGISTQETLLALIDRFWLEEVARKRMNEFDVKEPWEVFLALDLRHYGKMLADLPTLRRAQVGPTVALLHEVRSAGYKTGLASMTTRDLVFDILRALDLLKEFDLVATCEDVQRGKPAPDIFLLVAHKLAVSPSKCLVIEDSPTGVQAAMAAGMRCIAVPTAFSRPLFAGQEVLDPQWIVDDPTKLGPAVERLLSEQGVVGLPQMRTGGEDMKLGMIGLGRMGSNMTRRLLRAGHQVVAYDLDAAKVDEVQKEGAEGTSSRGELVGRLAPPRAVWCMLPAGEATEQTIEALIPLLSPGDVVIDGGNSNYKDAGRRAERLHEHGMHFLDVGTSGGVWGLTEGYSLMVGGEKDIVERLSPIFQALAPAPEVGWGHVGPTGAGHFVKMVHNGIEYGMMQAFAEGFEIMHGKEAFGLDLAQVAEIWRHGSVVRSWLLDLTAAALSGDQDLSEIQGWVADSGEGRWTVAEAIELDVPAPVITLSLLMRLVSRQDESYAAKLVAAMRKQFGGHPVKRRD